VTNTETSGGIMDTTTSFTKSVALKRLTALAQQGKANAAANNSDKCMVTLRDVSDIPLSWGGGTPVDTSEFVTLADAASDAAFVTPGTDVQFVILKRVGYGNDTWCMFDRFTANIGTPDVALTGVGGKPRTYGAKNRLGF
jgi:hypothetical protein